jgi:hypothetical protein
MASNRRSSISGLVQYTYIHTYTLFVYVSTIRMSSTVGIGYLQVKTSDVVVSTFFNLSL